MGQKLDCFSAENLDTSDSVWKDPNFNAPANGFASLVHAPEVVGGGCPGEQSVCCSSILQRKVDDKTWKLPQALEYEGTEVVPLATNAPAAAKLLLGNEVFFRALHSKNLAVELGANSQGDLLIGYEGAVAVAEGLKQLPNLENISLAMRYNCVGEEGAKVLFDSFKPMHNLRRLILLLGNNSIGTKGCRAAAESLKALQSLTMLELNFWKNGLMVDGVRALFAGLQSLSNLTQLSLNLDSNSLSEESGAAMEDLCRSMQMLTRLRLNLSDNRLKSGVRKMAEGWLSSPAPSLTELWLTLGKNGLEDEDICALMETLTKFEHLETLKLDLRSNSFGDKGAIALAKRIANLKKLTEVTLGLQHNVIGDEGCGAIKDSLKLLPHLTSCEVDIRNNSLTSFGEQGKINDLEFAEMKHMVFEVD
eukprot:gnl/MRDRNA2_/MRDRNA2_18019_c0_seq1.p1 gnl/MRDRNA2_/MRDRNA2_18019_c0~~gnl/MRDRNA2_/MRDRNA2_18019_c0_seq1.p1  ORF type:complete len:420 (-),score=72.96 gnl/MRDRNA2_/MRDRNA2_18019_c0_seq1:106-1365(-)